MTASEDDRRAWFRREILPLEGQLRAYARRFGRHGRNEVEDLVHETFARAIAFDGWACVDNPAAFAMRILRNIAFDAQRREKLAPMEQMGDFEAVGIVDDAPDPEIELLYRDELARLLAIVEDLPDQIRRVFTLRKVYGLSHSEVADRLGLSVSTVEKHLAKGLRICSDKLGRGAASSEITWSGRLWGRKRYRDESL